MITNTELFRKLMFTSKALRMKSFPGKGGPCGRGERPERPERPEFPQGPGCPEFRGRPDFPGRPPMPPEGPEGRGFPGGEDRPPMPPMPPFGGPHGRGPGCHGRRGHHGLSRERLLLFVDAHPEKVWQKDIAGEEGINASSVSEMIARLEADGFLTRETDETDKRAMVLKLTEKGKERAEEIRAEREASLNELFARLTDEEKQTLADLLDKILG